MTQIAGLYNSLRCTTGTVRGATAAPIDSVLLGALVDGRVDGVGIERPREVAWSSVVDSRVMAGRVSSLMVC